MDEKFYYYESLLKRPIFWGEGFTKNQYIGDERGIDTLMQAMPGLAPWYENYDVGCGLNTLFRKRIITPYRHIIGLLSLCIIFHIILWNFSLE